MKYSTIFDVNRNKRCGVRGMHDMAAWLEVPYHRVWWRVRNGLMREPDGYLGKKRIPVWIDEKGAAAGRRRAAKTRGDAQLGLLTGTELAGVLGCQVSESQWNATGRNVQRLVNLARKGRAPIASGYVGHLWIWDSHDVREWIRRRFELLRGQLDADEMVLSGMMRRLDGLTDDAV